MSGIIGIVTTRSFITPDGIYNIDQQYERQEYISKRSPIGISTFHTQKNATTRTSHVYTIPTSYSNNIGSLMILLFAPSIDNYEIGIGTTSTSTGWNYIVPSCVDNTSKLHPSPLAFPIGMYKYCTINDPGSNIIVNTTNTCLSYFFSCIVNNCNYSQLLQVNYVPTGITSVGGEVKISPYRSYYHGNDSNEINFLTLMMWYHLSTTPSTYYPPNSSIIYSDTTGTTGRCEVVSLITNTVGIQSFKAATTGATCILIG